MKLCDLIQLPLFLILILKIQQAFFQSIESTEDENRTKFVRKYAGKVNKVLPIKRANIARIWRIPKPYDSQLDNAKNQRTISSSENEIFEDFNTNKLVEALRRGSDEHEIQQRMDEGQEGAKSWEHLNKILGEEKIKSFLMSLPLDILREVTSLTRRNPKQGEKKLLELYMKENGNLSKSKYEYETENHTPTSSKELQFHLYSIHSYSTTSEPSNAQMASSLEDLETPKYTDKLPASDPISKHIIPFSIIPSTSDISRKEIMLESRTRTTGMSTSTTTSPKSDDDHAISGSNLGGIEVPQNESVTNNIMTNSGYYIPELTTNHPPPTTTTDTEEMYPNNDFDEYEDQAESPTSWFGETHNPMNTFNPKIDSFLNPPPEEVVASPPPLLEEDRGGSGGINLVAPNDYVDSYHPMSLSSSYFHHKVGEMENNPDRQLFVGETSPPIAVIGGNGNNHFSGSPRPHQHQQYHDFNPPQSNIDNLPVSLPLVDRNHNAGFIRSAEEDYNSYQPVNNFNNNNNHQMSNTPLHDDHQPKPQPPQYKFSPPSHDSHGGGGGGGWSEHPSGGWKEKEDDRELDFIKKIKSYFKSGKKSPAEKVFEVTISILSFLAFGGYLVMLVYTVFATTTRVPLFPLFSSSIPKNPTLFGLLIGREGNKEGNYEFHPEVLFNGKYIEEIERVVKAAMDKVKQEWDEFKQN